ncbi:OmpA family protein [Halarcobacter anaerophilus]|uniref:OmpA family protein n=1 Tax=Halarcobacter anaerophilus TaxID=877500 RepID=UPI000697747D|nr:OmpA family protein [Halarcobacter anaerophilus]
MSSEKKVVFLFLLLIILIVSCVYYHAPKMVQSEDSNLINQPTKIAIVEDNQDSDIKKAEENNIPISEENNILENSEDTKISDSLEKKEDITPIEEQVEEDTSPKEALEKIPEEQVQENVEEIEEKAVEPLIITGKKYIREGNEKPIEELSIKTQELQLEINKLVKEKPVIFKRAGYKTTKKSDITIKQIADILKQYPSIRIEIAGHTDAVGAAKMNQQISLARAQSVRNRLISFGISSKRLVARGYGENIPLENTGGYSKINRRVEFNIIEE